MYRKVFSVNPNNPRCFHYQGKPFKILTSAEHYGAVLNADFDYDVYLKEMKPFRQIFLDIPQLLII